MPWFARFMNSNYLLMDEKKDGDGGGGGGAGPTESEKKISSLETANAELLKRLEALEGKKKDDDKNKDDKDLNDKAEELRKQKEKEAGGLKATEAAIHFNLKASEFVKTNEALLPKDFKGLLETAEKETFESEVAKSNSIKAGMIKSYFSVQANLDLLTPSQKTVLDEYLKMTNNARQEKASEIYGMIFEPTFEGAKRTRKAQALGKDHDASDAKEAYKNKLMALGREHYLGEKKNA